MTKIKKNYVLDERAVAVINEVARLCYMKQGEALSAIVCMYGPKFFEEMRRARLEGDVDLYNLYQLAGIAVDPKDFGLEPLEGEEDGEE